MVNWDNIRTADLEYAEHAFNHGIKKEEYEELFRHPFYKKKFKYKGELRYTIIGKSYGRYILAIITASRSKLRIFSGREASEGYKSLYKNKYDR